MLQVHSILWQRLAQSRFPRNAPLPVGVKCRTARFMRPGNPFCSRAQRRSGFRLRCRSISRMRRSNPAVGFLSRDVKGRSARLNVFSRASGCLRRRRCDGACAVGQPGLGRARHGAGVSADRRPECAAGQGKALPRRRIADRNQLQRHHRQQQSLEASLETDRNRGADGFHGFDSGGNRHGQGPARAGRSRPQSPERATRL